MGTMIGHVAPGIGFLAIGLWHLFNNLKNFSRRPATYTTAPWFPAPLWRHLELYVIMVGSCLSVAMELFIGPERHQPLDDDGTIPSNHLHNFEHASISLTFLIYAASAVALDGRRGKAAAAARGVTYLLSAAAFAQQLLLFHLHSADHMGMEGQYHWFLQLVIAVTLAGSVLGVAHPRSFLVAFVRSGSIAFQGVWFVAMGVALWTPGLVPKGCFINQEDGHEVVRCGDDDHLHRGRSLVTILFSWFLAGFMAFLVLFYLAMGRAYPEEPSYVPIIEEEEEEEEEDLEAQKITELRAIGKGIKSIHLER